MNKSIKRYCTCTPSQIREQKFVTADIRLRFIRWILILILIIGNCQQVLEISRFLFSIDASQRLFEVHRLEFELSDFLSE